jgi:colanic acid biosynthesis glycosyl transferase WcaI
MRVFFLNRFFYPDHSATSQMLSDLAFELAARGHDVEVITSVLTYSGSRISNRRETVRGVAILRLPTTAFGRTSLAGRAMDYLAFYVSALLSLLWRVKRGDIVVAKTDPPMLSLITAPVCAIKGARSVNWLQDLFPEVAIALGFGRGRNRKWVLTLLLKLRNFSLRKASANVVIGESMARNLCAIGIPESKIRIIPNWASVTIRPIAHSQNLLRSEWGLNDSFVVGYSGNLGRAHEIDTFLSAIPALEEYMAEPSTSDKGKLLSPPRIRWLFIGGGSRMEDLKREAAARKLENVIFQPYQPRDRLPESLSLPDVHLISLRSELEGLVIPSKYHGIAAAGRPAIFVGHPDGEIARIIKRSGTGFAVCEGDGKALAQAVMTLAEDAGLAAALGQKARALFESKFDFLLAAGAWEQVLTSVQTEAQASRGLGVRWPWRRS